MFFRLSAFLNFLIFACELYFILFNDNVIVELRIFNDQFCLKFQH